MSRRKSQEKREEQWQLPFDCEEVEGESRLTSFSGAHMVAEMYRACGAGEAVRSHVKTRERIRERGLTDERMVESFAVMIAMGGECLDDFARFREEDAQEKLLGYRMPSPSLAKKFLYSFHDDRAGAEADEIRLKQRSFVPAESDPLSGLSEALAATARAARSLSGVDRATIDLDATIIVSNKRQAETTYTGEKGYQPIIALWAEEDIILADEFRDGNVPASSEPLNCLRRAFSALPDGVERVYMRGDSACHEHGLISWCDERDEEGDPRVVYAVSARMTVQLRSAVERLCEESWRPFDRDGVYAREWAEVDFAPSLPYERKGARSPRYIALRVRPLQGELFDDGCSVKHYCVVTNDWGREGDAILRWHREKAGTVEHAHDVLKNELGAGVMPCSRFGSNGAWLRLNSLTYNLLSLMRRHALPQELGNARPKRLRFHLLCRAGEIICHARKVILRVVGRDFGFHGILCEARRRIRRIASLLTGADPPVLQPAV